MSLTTIGGVATEQARIYRASLNGHIKPSDMCRFMFGLREIRCSLEAIPPETAAAETPVTTVNVVTVPVNHYLHQLEELSGRPPYTLERVIEHESTLALEAPGEANAPPIEAIEVISPDAAAVAEQVASPEPAFVYETETQRLCRLALEEEARGGCIVMRDVRMPRRPMQRGPSWD